MAMVTAKGNSRTLDMACLHLANELLQAMAIPRNHAAVASRRHRNLTDVQIPVRICPHVMWGKEISHGTRVGAAAPSGEELAFLVENTQPGADGIGPRVLPRKQSGAEADFRHEHIARGVDKNLHRPCHVGPFGQEFAFPGEDLDPAVLPVGDIDAAVRAERNAVRQIELAGAAARLAPGEEQPSVRALP
jgi:hypothetical protein